MKSIMEGERLIIDQVINWWELDYAVCAPFIHGIAVGVPTSKYELLDEIFFLMSILNTKKELDRRFELELVI